MSPRKLTEDDKQEILKQYRNSEATTSTLAKSYEVSSSTISRFLKNNLSSTEYEDLIQQKRLARTPRGEKSSHKAKDKNIKKTKTTKTEAKKVIDIVPEETVPQKLEIDTVAQPEAETKATIPRRRRRRRSTASEALAEAVISEMIQTELDTTVGTEIADQPQSIEPEMEIEEQPELVEEVAPAKLVLDKKVRSKSDSEELSKSDRPILKSDRVEPEEDEDEDAMDLNILKEMLGEDIEDINDDEDEDEDDWEEDEGVSYLSQPSSLSDVRILPLSQASLPRTCYIVIDRSAELIVKPLADFGDLGIIPEAEVTQRTLPVFDNHRIAKRFSHRRERVIKVPDGRMLQKTSHHLQIKGITRLLIDGQIYSLSN